jgi:hypothetical protein
MKLHIHAALGVLVCLTFVPTADAQLLWRWFGPKTPEKTPPAKSPLPDARRITEVNVEISWLADPVTFPYYLEAHATPKHLEVRGYVPNKAVRDHALKIAQVYSSMPVVDSMKEHPSLLVRPGQISPQQLQSSAQSSLRVALPKQHQQLKVDVAPDGKVFVSGAVSTYEEKVAVSQSLRRLHGCTSVQNLTALPAEMAQAPSTEEPPREKTPIINTSNSPESKSDKPAPAPVQETKSRSWLWPFGKSAQTTKDEPPLLEQKKPAPSAEARPTEMPAGPVLIPNAPDNNEPIKSNPAAKVEPPAPAPKTPPLSATELQKRIKAACPAAKSVEVEFTSNTEVRILLEIRNEKELAPAAERVFAIPELERYRPDLQFKISAP